MPREDIVAGLKNALERGYPLQAAVQSLVNAGYNAKEVQEAANSFSNGAMSILEKKSSAEKEIQQEPTKQLPISLPEKLAEKAAELPKKSKKLKIILLIIMLIVIAIAAITLLFLF